MEPKYFPILITERRMKHIQSRPGRGHITREEIEEVAADPIIHKPNSKDKTADRILIGQALNGKQLVLYVKLLEDAGRFRSKLITAHPWS